MTTKLNFTPTKELIKAINSVNILYNVEQFEKDALDYISAIEQGRMLCIINSVSRSGMSRTLAFKSCEQGTNNRFFYRQYWAMFKALGYKEARGSRDYFTVNGCGMDMVFHTNYTIIGNLASFGLLSKEEAETLRQQTPTVL